MEKYVVKSAFCVGNQIVHVEMANKRGVAGAMFPIKFAPLLNVGTRICVFSDKNDKNVPIAYKFADNLCFAATPRNKWHAYSMYADLAGVREFSFDKMRFRSAMSRALKSSGVVSCKSIAKDILALHGQNQK